MKSIHPDIEQIAWNNYWLRLKAPKTISAQQIVDKVTLDIEMAQRKRIR